MKPLPGPVAVAVRSLASGLSRRGPDAKLLILIFHRVLAEPDPLHPDEPTAGEFAARMDLVRSLFSVFSLQEAVARRESGTLPARSACITFDDGYRNNREIAAPILADRGMVGTFFVATGYLDGGRMWNDSIIEAIRRAPATFDLRHIDLGIHELPDYAARFRLIGELIARIKHLAPAERLSATTSIVEACGARLPTDLMMSTGQVREMHALGMEIGAHTVTHPILAKVEDEVARREIVDSRRRLQEIIGADVTSFAYPNGRPARDYAAAHPAMVREAGFQAAVTTAWGASSAGDDVFQLPRLSPWDNAPGRYTARLLRSYLSRPADRV